MTFPQHWDGATLSLRVLGTAARKSSPGADRSHRLRRREPETHRKVCAHAGQSPLTRPTPWRQSISAYRFPLTAWVRSLRSWGQCSISLSPKASGSASRRATRPQFLRGRYFRAAMGRERSGTDFGSVDHEYKCALKAASVPSKPPPPKPSDHVSWGDVLHFALRNPNLPRNWVCFFKLRSIWTRDTRFATEDGSTSSLARAAISLLRLP